MQGGWGEKGVCYSRVHSALCPARGQQSGKKRLGRHRQKRPCLCVPGKGRKTLQRRGDLEETKCVRVPREHACQGALRPLLLTLTSAVSDSCDPVGYSPPGSSVHGALQAIMLEWVARPSSRGSS